MRKKRSKLPLLLLLMLLPFLGFVVWWNIGTSPVAKNSTEKIVFVVPKGAGVKQIASDLKNQGLIKDEFLFYLIVKRLNLENKIQAGDFRLSPSQSAEEIAQNLTHGSLDVWVTIPEGKRAEEIADILKQSIPSFEESWRDVLVQNEGYLFPDTYLIPKDATIEQITSLMRNTFDAKYATVSIPNTAYTKEQQVIIASLIEREAITDEEKPVIAGILYNRLKAGMALQVDATIQYAKGKNFFNGKWWEPVTLAEYKSVKSQYNTYLYPGLPPGPISNPGIEALKAAANPEDSDYIFYLHDKTGTIRYAKTLEQHNANIERYGL